MQANVTMGQINRTTVLSHDKIKEIIAVYHETQTFNTDLSAMCGNPQLQVSYRIILAFSTYFVLNPLTPNDPYSGRTAPLTSKC